MAWVRPVGFEDPDEKWINGGLGYDDDVTTYAEWVGMVRNRFSPPLVLRFPTVVADELRLFIGCPENLTHWRIMLYDGLAWTFAPEPDDVSGWDWRSIKFPEQTVTKIELRFLNYGSPPNPGGVAEVVLNWVCRGPLVAICGFLGKGGEFFDGLVDSIEDWAIVGDALAGPFRTLSGLFNTASQECCQASGALQDILDTIEGGITWTAIVALLEEHAPSLYALLTDPVGYITGIVSGLIPELPAWIDDPLAWLTDMLEENFPLLYYLVVDPGGELLYLIAQLFDLTPYQAQSPEFVVKSLVERYFPLLYSLWLDPEAWLVEHVDPRIAAVFGEIADFLDNPWGWLLDKFEDVFEDKADQIKYLVEHAIRFIWEGEW